ncbi:hypothetical protein BN946_scf185042.g7 [Trametes cinnabarina]|uniref:NAD(P)-binding protein n=1 Tax=Pycnoporus cinnabarinus TaxID=5643 RepID=A0A060S451_PYCCI|nr:hypothetical protein BN946_scf185042.g7 [Trametes cinnabarina]
MPATARTTAWLVNGTSRGIGLEIVKQLVASPDNLVIATCRNPEKATVLSDLKATAKGTLHIVQIDVSDFTAIRAAGPQLESILGDVGLDYLINCAVVVRGISRTANSSDHPTSVLAQLHQDTAFTMDPEDLLHSMRTNALGAAVLAQVVLPFLEKGRKKVILNISSTGGSLHHAVRVGPKYTSYAMCKAALNMLTLKQSVARPDFIVMSLCPGRVKTDLGGPQATLEPAESVAGILKVVTAATKEHSGKFLSYDGSEVAW